MTATQARFYQIGGSLVPNAPSYVLRRADEELYEGLLQGEFCYVLTARQMGKSSLMVRTATRLREEGTAVVVLDLTAIGQNLSPDQWYDGLRELLGLSLDLEDELDEFWLAHPRLGPLQRFMAALRQVVLPHVFGRLVIFVDEIDAVRSLPFSTDEFFAAIRECYNRRTEDPQFARLTFCLLGVASPSDLIRDVRTTPFNIGRRIELTDFTAAEAAPLAEGLGRPGDQARMLLERVLYWTGGHPYLTQRFCHVVAGDETVTEPAGVDRLCQELFLSRGARERDDNLLFVRERLLRSEVDLASLLDLYGQVRRGRRVRDEETDPRVSLLRLSGIVRSVAGELHVRNRIYARVFDGAWVQANMPDAELRRQRAAYRRGLWRAAAVSAVILTIMGSLAIAALEQARLAQRASLHALRQQRAAQEGQAALRRQFYASQMSVAAQALELADQRGTRELLDAWRPIAGQEDLRGWAWRYLWRQAREKATGPTLPTGQGWVNCVAFSPDGHFLATGGGDGTVKLWDPVRRRQLAVLNGHRGSVNSIAFTRDGSKLVTVGTEGTVRAWQVAARRAVTVVDAHADGAALSPDGKLLVTSDRENQVRLWRLAPRRPPVTLEKSSAGIRGLALSPDGRLLAVADSDFSTVRLLDLRARRVIAALKGQDVMQIFGFSPDGKILAVAEGMTTSVVRLWDVGSRQILATLLGHRSPISALAFSRDGRWLATSAWDATIRLWDMKTREEAALFRGHWGSGDCLAFTPDGRTLVSRGETDALKFWPIGNPPEDLLGRHGSLVTTDAFSRDGRTLASADVDGVMRVWDVAARREIATFRSGLGSIQRVALSPDGKIVAAGNHDQRVQVWDVATRRELASLKGKPAGTPSFERLATVAFSPEGTLLAWGSHNTGDNTIRLWDFRARKEVARLPGHAEVAGRLAFSPDGRTLASSSHDRTVRLWAAENGHGWHEIGRFRGFKYLASTVAFSPDGKLLAAGDGVETVRVWDVAARREVALLTGIHTEIDWLGFSPDGRTLIVSGADGGLRLWNTASWVQAGMLKIPRLDPYAVDISPVGNTLAVGRTDGEIRLLRAATLEEADREMDPPRVSATGANQSVSLQWRPLPYADGYNVYRGPAGRSGQLEKVTSKPITEASFTDLGAGLTNGRPMSYSVAPVIARSGRPVVEGQRATLQATPVASPPGWIGASLNEGGRGGSAVIRQATGEILIRGSGQDIWAEEDGCYIMSQSVSGDFQVRVKVLAGPTRSHEWAKAGLMIRDSLDSGARNVALFATPIHGLSCQWRPVPSAGSEAVPRGSIEVPSAQRVVLRLTRRGNTINAEYSRDNGTSFHPAGDPVTFDPPLPQMLYAGLAITSHDPDRTSQAQFARPEIKPQ